MYVRIGEVLIQNILGGVWVRLTTFFYNKKVILKLFHNCVPRWEENEGIFRRKCGVKLLIHTSYESTPSNERISCLDFIQKYQREFILNVK